MTSLFSIETLSIILVSMGLFFFFGAAVGLFRFPDFYTRMHAAGKGDTLSTILLIFGCGLHYMHLEQFSTASILVFVKLLLIVVFIFVGSPTATHAIMNAGYKTEVKHWTKEDRK